MILLCGIPSEAPLRLAIEAADRLGVAYLLFNQRLAMEMALEYRVTSSEQTPWRLEGSLSIRDRSAPLETISGAYIRLMDYQEIPEYKRPESEAAEASNPNQRIEILHQALIDWLEVADLRVMNRLSAMGSNQSKPYQAQLIAQAGFLIPPTLITNDPQAASAFFERHGRVVYKSISAVRSVVQELQRSRLHELEKIRYLPTQFQAYIPGDNLRVHVAGEQVFATQIETSAVDYRYAGREGLDLEMKAVYIEDGVAAGCRALARRLGLPLCGIDLKRTPQGAMYCFEVNPSPAYSYYQEQTGQDVAAGIVEYLAGK